MPRYQRQHQLPFRRNLYDKAFHGHVARIAEGAYEAWFGWPNLTNKVRAVGLRREDRSVGTDRGLH